MGAEGAGWCAAPLGAALVSSCPLLRSQGVIEFSLCLLFAKLVSYTFLYWLPLYIFNVGAYRGGEVREASGPRGNLGRGACDSRIEEGSLLSPS